MFVLQVMSTVTNQGCVVFLSKAKSHEIEHV